MASLASKMLGGTFLASFARTHCNKPCSHIPLCLFLKQQLLFQWNFKGIRLWPIHTQLGRTKQQEYTCHQLLRRWLSPPCWWGWQGSGQHRAWQQQSVGEGREIKLVGIAQAGKAWCTWCQIHTDDKKKKRLKKGNNLFFTLPSFKWSFLQMKLELMNIHTSTFNSSWLQTLLLGASSTGTDNLIFFQELCIPPPKTQTFSSSDAVLLRTAAMPPEIAAVPYGPRKKQLRAQSWFCRLLPAQELLDKGRCSLPGSCHTGGRREHRGSPPHSAGGPAKGRPGPLQPGQHPPTWMAALQRQGREKRALNVKPFCQHFCYYLW